MGLYDFDPDFEAKYVAMKTDGPAPYPNGMAPTHTSTQLHEQFAGVADPAESPQTVAVAGRVMFRNRMGRAMFLRLLDRGTPVVVGTNDDGTDDVRDGIIQVYLRREEVGDDAFATMKALDVGDVVWAQGHVMRTRTGELSVQAAEVKLASKILTPFPDRWHGLQDPEARSRMRYVDLFMNGDTREVFRRRSAIVRIIRDFFQERDYLEVETPILHSIPGGANARPFQTHHNALDISMYLRIAPELFLKRLLVGGLERVFELNRSFRNEGVSLKHNPEFTMLEFYEARATYTDFMDLTEELFVRLADQVVGARQFRFGEHELDFTPPFRRADMDDLIAEATGIAKADLWDPAVCEAWWRANHPVASDEVLPSTPGKWWEWLFDAHVEGTLVNPTFVTGFPAEISPLARRRDDDPRYTDRFELIVATWEIANAFSELNDPVLQAAAFEAQVAAKDLGDDEAMAFDADYVRALTYGMPPAAGQGIGIDRLVMLLTGRTSIREVILFPTMRPERPAPSAGEDDS